MRGGDATSAGWSCSTTLPGPALHVRQCQLVNVWPQRSSQPPVKFSRQEQATRVLLHFPTAVGPFLLGPRPSPFSASDWIWPPLPVPSVPADALQESSWGGWCGGGKEGVGRGKVLVPVTSDTSRIRGCSSDQGTGCVVGRQAVQTLW